MTGPTDPLKPPNYAVLQKYLDEMSARGDDTRLPAPIGFPVVAEAQRLRELMKDQALCLGTQALKVEALATVLDEQATQLWMRATEDDPSSPLYNDPSDPHWHVLCHAEDDGLTESSVFLALGYAAEQLESVADSEADGAAAAAGSGHFEQAGEATGRVSTFATLAANASNLHVQAIRPPWGRMPLYASENESDNRKKLLLAAMHAVEEINSKGPRGFRVWPCSDTDCVIDSDQWEKDTP